MKKTVALLLTLALAAGTAAFSLAGCVQSYIVLGEDANRFVLDESWVETFSDEFDGDRVDATKWRTRHAGGMRNSAYYSADEDTLFVRDGALTIRTAWKNGSLGEGFYTGWLETRDNADAPYLPGQDISLYRPFSQTYGYFEIRCKVAEILGAWSAFWLLPKSDTAFTDRDRPNTGRDGAEIDVMESPFAYASPKNLVSSAIHCDSYQKDKIHSLGSPKVKIENLYEDFHTYALEWNAEEYIVYIDGKESWRTDFYNGTSEVPEFLILSSEVGGSNDGTKPTGYDVWCGDPLKNDKSKNYDFTVDYVRVYRKA